jgi:RNA polymerase sigma factor (sigma-70 family)
MADSTRPELLRRVKGALVKALGEQGTWTPADRAAWEEFFDLYNGILTRFAFGLGCGPGETDDLLQDVWTDVIRLLPKFEYDAGRGGFRRWLYRILRSKVADFGRRRRRLTATQEQAGAIPGGLEAVPDSDAEDPARAMERKFLVEVVHVATERFRTSADPADWQVFEGCKLRGETSAQIGAALGISPEATRKRLQRALGQFRQVLTQIIGRVEPGEDWL